MGYILLHRRNALRAQGVTVGYLVYKEEQSPNTAGGTFTTGAWRTRTINVEETDTDNNGSLSANQITLDAGTYTCHIIATARSCNGHQAKLYDVTGAADLLFGTTGHDGGSNTTNTHSIITGRFTLSVQSALEVRQRGGFTGTFGLPANIGSNEVYLIAEFLKE